MQLKRRRADPVDVIRKRGQLVRQDPMLNVGVTPLHRHLALASRDPLSDRLTCRLVPTLPELGYEVDKVLELELAGRVDVDFFQSRADGVVGAFGARAGAERGDDFGLGHRTASVGVDGAAKYSQHRPIGFGGEGRT